MMEFDLLEYRPEDGGVLDAWLDHYGDSWLYVTGYECWYRWADICWSKDETQEVQCQIQNLLDAMNRMARAELAAARVEAKAAEEDDDDKRAEEAEGLAKTLAAYVQATKRTRNRVASIEGMAQAQRAKMASSLDAGNVLNLRNGTLDLQTITLHPHHKDDLLTYVLDYDFDPDASAPRFEQFVQQVLIDEETGATDMELCALFQELLGYSLSNETQHEVMTWLSGDGGNGKTVAITLVQKLLGPLCCSVDFQTVGMPGNYDLAEIPGKRVIFSTESERGGRMAEGYIKRIVSGERINARAIYGKPFEFQSTAKVWWAMNDKPIVKDTGNAIWRRLKLIPFNRTFTEKDRDPKLLATLEGQLPGILNFALDGLQRLRKRGRLPEARAVADAIEEYRQESNAVQQWKDERAEDTMEPETRSQELYQDYSLWCARNGRQAMNTTNFGKELRRLKVEKKSAVETGWDDKATSTRCVWHREFVNGFENPFTVPTRGSCE